MPADRGGDPAGNFGERRLIEAVRVRVLRCAGHPAVVIAQPVHPRQAEGLGRAAELGGAQLAGAGVAGQQGSVHRSGVAVGGAHKPDLSALCGILCQGAAGAERLVVGMGKNRQEAAVDGF